MVDVSLGVPRASRRSSLFLETSVGDLALLLFLNLALFGEAIQGAMGFSYCDEIATIAVVCAAFFRFHASKNALADGMSTSSRLALVWLFVVVSAAFLGNAFCGVHASTAAILTDFLTCCKFPIALIASIYAFACSERLSTLFEIEAKILLVVMTVLGIGNLFFDFGMGSEARFGIRASFTFVFDHPTYLVFCAAGLTAFLMKDRERNMPFIVMGMLVVLLSLRSKGFAFAAVCLLLLLTFGKSNRLSVVHIALGLAAVALIGMDQYINYYQSAGYARGELARQAIAVANDYFPLGTGFATYGSAVTAQIDNYSPLYYAYGLSTVWGLAPGAASFLSDTFWPTVLAQFGYFGLVAFAALLIALFVMCYKAGGGSRLPVICIFAYLLISSTSESSFFNPSAAYLAMCAGLAICPAGERRS
ncbi:hypothetical protein [uncultured Senegalimassilia sp.]|uniref:hypothetical protein n=1 Tax=uncultured Senegalimassilia sp. TaxID=1714350 RepID=UPI0027DE95D7|nr:hypothetical protein [uncultured Senegalimassilia sp.]